MVGRGKMIANGIQTMINIGTLTKNISARNQRLYLGSGKKRRGCHLDF